jgi:long-chain acyl-CoA synthetase
MNIPYCLRRAERLFGDRPAVLLSDGSITYSEFAAGAHRGAARLAELGLATGDRFAILMANSATYLELYYAAGTAGVVPVPLNLRWNIDDIAFVLNDSGSKALIADERMLGLVTPIRERCPHLRMIFAGQGACPEGFEDYRTPCAPLEFPEPAADDLAALFYTSGTTGGPKGVMLTHRNLYANALTTLIEDIAGDRVILIALPMFHMAGAAMIYAQPLAGGRFCFLPGFDPVGVLEAVQKYRVESLVLVPSMWLMLLRHPDFDRYDLSSVTRAGWGASPMPMVMQEEVARRLPVRIFHHVYGLTETSPFVTINTSDGPSESAGREVCGVEMRIFDDDDCELPAGQAGEIVVRGDNVMPGYWKRPEVNREVLRNGWLHTGDIGRIDAQGKLYILDRKKDMIKTGSENVYSPEVESMLMTHPAVLEAAVIGVPHEKWGETIRAVVTLRVGAELTESELIAWMRERMTHFKCPTSVVFMAELPKTATGKVQKPKLRSEASVAKSAGG